MRRRANPALCFPLSFEKEGEKGVKMCGVSFCEAVPVSGRVKN